MGVFSKTVPEGLLKLETYLNGNGGKFFGKCFHLGGLALPAVYGSRSRDDWKQPDSGCISQPEGLVCEDLRGSRCGQVDRDPAQEPFLKCSYSEVHSSDSCFKHL